MQKYLSIVLAILLVWGSSCDHDETRIQQVATEKKITITDLEHEPAVKELLSNVQGSFANGRISSLEIADAFFKYSEPDSGILNIPLAYPMILPITSRTLYYHNMRMVSMDLYTAISWMGRI
jgi:hypothetical protein